MKDLRALFIPGRHYHVFNRSIGSERLFVLPGNYSYFLQLAEKYVEPLADLYCYSLVPRHFHFFIRIREEEVLTAYMEKLHYFSTAPYFIPQFILQRFSNFSMHIPKPSISSNGGQENYSWSHSTGDLSFHPDPSRRLSITFTPTLRCTDCA